ncbi:MAG: lectin-like protein, partial [Bacteroidota bacterium]
QNGGNAIVAPVLNDGLIYLLNGTVDWTNVEFGNEFTDLNDTKPPVAGCRSGVTLRLDENGEASITPADVDKGSYGSCGATLANLSIDRSDFTTADLGAQAVLLTVTDNLGVSASCEAVVIVLPFIPPVVPVDDPDITFSCPPDITVTGLPGAGNAEASWTEPTASSTCTTSGGGGSGTLECNISNNLPNFDFLGEIEGRKYYVSDHPANWHTARERAINAGGYLAVINDQAENDFLQGVVNRGTTWIGFTDQDAEGNFVWDNGEAVGYTNWNPGEPNDQGLSGTHADFAVFINSSGRWFDRSGSTENYYLLEVPCPTTAPACSELGNNLAGFSLIGELDNSKYFYSDHQSTWFDAQNRAQLLGGYLVVITSAAENELVKNGIAATSWIGLNDAPQEGNFNWINGESLTYTNWNGGEPNNQGNEDYGEMYTSGLWNDQEAHLQRRYVIEIPCAAPLPLCSDLPNDFPGFSLIGEFNNSRYFYASTSISWGTAQDRAEAIGGHLVVINSAEENQYIQNNVNTRIWIGLSDEAQEGNFRWVNGDPVDYTNWNPGEPNNSNNEDFGELLTNGRWNDLNHSGRRPYIVEIPCVAPIVRCEQVPNNIAGFSLIGEYNDHKYYASNGTARWDDAQAACAANGGHLVVINDDAENTFIFNNLNTSSGSIWTGLNTLSSPNDFQWVNGDPVTYLNWQAGEPNGSGTNQAARMKQSTGEWTDRPISNLYDYILEIPCPLSGPSNDPPVVTQIRGPQSGAQFPNGVTEVAYEVTDGCGNQEICTFEVTVEATPSEITLTDCPADLTIDTAPGATSVTVSYGPVAGTTTCFRGGLEIEQTQGPEIGDILRVKDGPQLVAFSLIDSCGNFASCVFTVTAIATPSAITMADCPVDINVDAQPGETAVDVTWIEPTATTTCFTGNVDVQRLEGPAPGSSFDAGSSTRIIYLIADECGNTEICIFFVNVSACPAAGTACDDGDPKTINDQEDGLCNCAGTPSTLNIDCPTDLMVDALPGATFAVVDWALPTTSGDCNVGSVDLQQTAGPASGSNLPLGTTTISYEATDGCTNTVSCSFTVTVNPTTSTVILDCPADLTVAAVPGAPTAQVSWAVPTPGSDCVIQPVNLVQTAGPDNGAAFPEGTTTVTYEATDGCGESATCSFTVTVTTSCIDNDGDGVCVADDCDDLDANIPAAPGTSCDDGDAGTENDVILADGCSCAGTPIDPCAGSGGDLDGDGVCAADDCDDLDANIPEDGN